MEPECENDRFFRLLQQIRRIHWGAELEVMTQTEFMAVSTIYFMHQRQPDKPGVYVSALAERMAISVSMASKMLKALEGRGWVLRTIDPERRRNTYVSLTESGLALYQSEVRRCRALNAAVQERVGPERVNRIMDDFQYLVECYADVLGCG